MKVAIKTIGCRFNQVESSEMRGILEEKGFEIVSTSEKADIYIINTCTVTGNSDTRSRQAIRKSFKKNKNAFIVVTGCYAQMNKNEVALLGKVDLVLGNNKKLNIVKHLEELVKSNSETKIDVDDIDNGERLMKSFPNKNYLNQSRAPLKVQTGCNNNCSYCIVVKARGKSISLASDQVEKQVNLLINKGFKEIVLTGVHIGSYGLDLFEKINIVELLKRLIKIEGLERIRLSSISPMNISDELITLISTSEKVCSHLHIPFQSGDDKILQKMRRDYDSGFFKNLILKLKTAIPHIGIGVDVIVGFPGERELEFLNTLQLVESLPITYLHVFRFSPRKGTDAYDFPDMVKESIKKDRSLRLKSLSNKKLLKFKEDHVGCNKKIIVESKRDRETGLLKGLTDNYMPVLIEGHDKLMNKLVTVNIYEIKNENIFGKIVSI